MSAHLTKEQRAARDADFKNRERPRLLWDSVQDGPAMRKRAGHPSFRKLDGYHAKPVVKPKSGARKLTEAEDNAIGRALRRRQNKALRGWLPYAQR